MSVPMLRERRLRDLHTVYVAVSGRVWCGPVLRMGMGMVYFVSFA